MLIESYGIVVSNPRTVGPDAYSAAVRVNPAGGKEAVSSVYFVEQR